MVFSKVKKYLENKIIKFKKDKDLFELLSGSATTLIVRSIGGALGFLFMLLVTKGYGEHGPEVWGKYLLGLLILKILIGWVVIFFQKVLIVQQKYDQLKRIYQEFLI